MASKDVEAIVEGFLKYLVNNGKDHLLPEIVRVLSSQVGLGSNSATVVSAVALSRAQQNTLAEIIKKDYGIKEITYEIDPTLIGGLKIMLGDSVLDLSTKAKLDQISNSLQG